MCYIWRCDRDDFDHSLTVHAYLQDVLPWNKIPFIFDASGEMQRIHHIWLNLRSSRPMILVDAFDIQYSARGVLLWNVESVKWEVFDYGLLSHNRYSPSVNTREMLYDALSRWYDNDNNRRALAIGSGFASRREIFEEPRRTPRSMLAADTRV